MACPHWPWQVALAVFSLILMLLCGFYVWYVAIAAAEGDVWGLVLFIGSIIVCVTIGIIGLIIAKIKWVLGLLLLAILIIISFIWHMFVIMVATITYADCTNERLLNATLCDEVDQYVYYLSAFAVLIDCMMIVLICLVLRRVIKAQFEDEDNYY